MGFGRDGGRGWNPVLLRRGGEYGYIIRGVVGWKSGLLVGRFCDLKLEMIINCDEVGELWTVI